MNTPILDITYSSALYFNIWIVLMFPVGFALMLWAASHMPNGVKWKTRWKALMCLGALVVASAITLTVAITLDVHNDRNATIQNWILDEFGSEIDGHDAYSLIASEGKVAIKHDGETIVVSLIKAANQDGYVLVNSSNLVPLESKK